MKDLRRPVLVVVPTSLVYNWMNETDKFIKTFEFEIFERKNQERLAQKITQCDENNPVFVIATYGLLTENEEFFSSIEWQIIIFDEAQYLKNISSKRTSTARLLNSDLKICLTGTPMENHYGEFFSLIDLILPGALGDYSKFRTRYMSVKPTKNDMDYIKLATHPLVLRRKKELILTELPPKVETPFKIDFNPKQQKIYRDLAITWNKNILDVIDKKGEANSQMEMLTALLRLRQVCSYPQLVPNVDFQDESPKEELLLNQVQQIVETGSSVLVFCHFKSSLFLAQKALEEKGLKTFAIYGDKKVSERKMILKSFEDHPEGSVLLMTLKTGGVGLNLTKASYVIHFEPWWNPAVEDQATDRAHRMGQVNSVQVYKYMMSNSIEERIQELKDTKKTAFNSLFESEGLEDVGEGIFNHSGLTQSDFHYLLG
jgi:SNF2 family DNA or RNA helicase